MTVAYVMLNCDLGAEADTLEQLKELENVMHVSETMGAHDMLIKIEAENFETVREIVAWKIKSIPHVRSTVTLVEKEDN